MTRLILTLCFIATYCIFGYLEDSREQYSSTAPAMDLLMNSFPSGLSMLMGVILILLIAKPGQFTEYYNGFTVGQLLYEGLQVMQTARTFDVGDLAVIGISYALIMTIRLFATRHRSSATAGAVPGAYPFFRKKG